jgi:uncharacterized RDD family membrane protein YckC
MTWQGSGGETPDGGGPPGDETRTDWEPPAAGGPPPSPEPSAASALPGPPDAPVPWPPAGPVAGSTWAPPPDVGGGRFAVPGAPGLVYAGALPRFAAFVVDMVIISIAVSIVALPFTPAVAQVTQTSDSWLSTSNYAMRSGVGSLIGVIGEALYFVLLWMSSGRATLGMRLFSLQVGRMDDGQRLPPRAALVRWLAFGSWFGLLGFVPALSGAGGLLQLVWSMVLLVSTIASPTHQGIHDRFAGSAVVRPANAGNGLAITCVVIALIVPFLLIVSFIALIFLGGQVSSILSAVGDSI